MELEYDLDATSHIALEIDDIVIKDELIWWQPVVNREPVRETPVLPLSVSVCPMILMLYDSGQSSSTSPHIQCI